MKMIHPLCIEKINVAQKKIFAILVLLMFTVTAFAQEAPKTDSTKTTATKAEPAKSESKVRLGLKAQPCYAWLKVKDPAAPILDGDGSKLGFSFGLMADFALTKNYFFSTGIDVSYRGGNLKSQADSTLQNGNSGDYLRTITSSNASLQYIEIPLTLKMKTNQIGNFIYFGQFGLAPGFNISSKADVHVARQALNNQGQQIALPNGYSSTSDVEGQDIKDDINNFNLSMVLALGLEYSLGGTTSVVGAITFNNGFTDVLDAGDKKAVSNTLGLTIGILF
jgi:hypothetical protein